MFEFTGGTFIYSKSPKALAEWYSKIFGFVFENEPKENGPFYCSFFYRTLGGEKRYVAWAILHNKNRPELSEKVFTLNYRVSEIEKLVEKLQQNGVMVKPVEEYPEGKFTSCNDPEGNSIELWEDTAKHE